MKNKDISILLIRILALYLFLQALSVLPMSIKIGVAGSLFFVFSQSFIIFLLSAILWFLAPQLSIHILNKSYQRIEIDNKFERETIEQILYSFVGLILVVVAIPSMSAILLWKSAFINLGSDLIPKSEAMAGYYSHITKYTFQFLLGLFLLIRPNYVTKLINLLRKTK